MIKHTVKPGESLSKIGQKYGYKLSEWEIIWKANPKIKNPNLIYAGQVVNVPEKSGSTQTKTAAKVTARKLIAQTPVEAGMSPVQMLIIGSIALTVLMSGKKGKK